MTIEKERQIVKVLLGEALDSYSGCNSCGSEKFLRVVETELVGSEVIPRRVIFQCAPCTDKRGGYSQDDARSYNGDK